MAVPSKGRVVDYRAVLADLPCVPRDRLVVEGRQHVDRVHVRPDWCLAQPDPEVAVLALDVRVVFPVTEDLETLPVRPPWRRCSRTCPLRCPERRRSSMKNRSFSMKATEARLPTTHNKSIVYIVYRRTYHHERAQEGPEGRLFDSDGLDPCGIRQAPEAAAKVTT